MNLGYVDQQDNLFRRYDLRASLNGLTLNPALDMYIGPNGFCPIRPANSTHIKIDYETGPGDLPKAHGPSEDVSEIIVGPVGQREIEAPYWRGKFSVDERTIVEMRRIGESGNMPGRVGYQAIRDRVRWARQTTDARMARAACEALYGSISLNYDAGSKITLDYQHSAQLRLDLETDSTRAEWNDHANAKPIDDLRLLKLKLMQFGAMDPAIILFGANVIGNLVQCEQYKSYVAQTQDAIEVTATMDITTNTFCGLRPMTAKGHYPILDRVATDVAASSLTVDVLTGDEGSFGDLVEGDTIVLKLSSSADNEEAEVLGTVASISGKTITFDQAIGKAFKAGDEVRWNRPFIGYNDVFILPMYSAGDWMQWSVAQSSHAGLRSQRYAVIDRMMPSIPEKYEIIFGVDGIPVFMNKNNHAYLKTL